MSKQTPPLVQNVPSPLQRFVTERIELNAIAEDYDKREALKQGVSIRLSPGHIRQLDHMAKQLEVSRQALLLEIVNSGLHEVINAWAHTHGDKAESVFKEIWDLAHYQEGDI